jgi:hypothetical protein
MLVKGGWGVCDERNARKIATRKGHGGEWTMRVL